MRRGPTTPPPARARSAQKFEKLHRISSHGEPRWAEERARVLGGSRCESLKVPGAGAGLRLGEARGSDSRLAGLQAVAGPQAGAVALAARERLGGRQSAHQTHPPGGHCSARSLFHALSVRRAERLDSTVECAVVRAELRALAAPPRAGRERRTGRRGRVRTGRVSEATVPGVRCALLAKCIWVLCAWLAKCAVVSCAWPWPYCS